MTSMVNIDTKKFQSTLPIQGETIMGLNFFDAWNISIHSPYTGRDYYERRYDEAVDISIHSPYTGRDKMYIVYTDYTGISIHSPYTGRDPPLPYNKIIAHNISIHSPYTGRDYSFDSFDSDMDVFQSTLPIQGETCLMHFPSVYLLYFNPLSLYRERP